MSGTHPLPIRDDLDARDDDRVFPHHKRWPTVAGSASLEAAMMMRQVIFGVRDNEIYPFSLLRPIHRTCTDGDWMPATVAARVFDQIAHDFYPLYRTADVVTWDPV